MLSTGGIQRLGQDYSIYSEFRAQQARCKTDVAALALPLEPPGTPHQAKGGAGHSAVSCHSLHLSAHGKNIKDMAASSVPPNALVRVLLNKCPSYPIPELLLKAAN